jgi:hypothetical protein
LVENGGGRLLKTGRKWSKLLEEWLEVVENAWKMVDNGRCGQKVVDIKIEIDWKW